VCIVATHKYFATAPVGLVDSDCHLLLVLGYCDCHLWRVFHETAVTIFEVCNLWRSYCGISHFDSCMNLRCHIDCCSNTPLGIYLLLHQSIFLFFMTLSCISSFSWVTYLCPVSVYICVSGCLFVNRLCVIFMFVSYQWRETVHNCMSICVTSSLNHCFVYINMWWYTFLLMHLGLSFVLIILCYRWWTAVFVNILPFSYKLLYQFTGISSGLLLDLCRNVSGMIYPFCNMLKISEVLSCNMPVFYTDNDCCCQIFLRKKF